jgi:ribosomal protein S18 acetylase RimI-like enzyme
MKTVYPQGCWGIKNEGVLEGYIFFHPYYEGMIKPLDHILILNGSENCMYLHDIAIKPLYRGLQHSKKLLEKFNMETTRQGFTIQCLVAVQNSHDFWMKYGFNTVREIENYGEGPAFFMKKVWN